MYSCTAVGVVMVKEVQSTFVKSVDHDVGFVGFLEPTPMGS